MNSEFFYLSKHKMKNKENTQRNNICVCLLKALPFLMLCQCVSNKATIEQRGLLAIERSNDKEHSQEVIEIRNKVREHLVGLMIKHQNDPFPLKAIDYPSNDISETEEIVAIVIYNNLITRLSKENFAHKLATLKFLVDSRKKERKKNK